MVFSLDTTIVNVSGGGGGGWIMLQDVTPTGAGAVGEKVYQTAENDILLTCQGDTFDLDILVHASGPRVKVNSTFQDLPQIAGQSHYSGVISITVPGTGNITARQVLPDSSEGATSECLFTHQVAPSILTCVFTGGYPGSQTQLKAGDSFQITGTTDAAANLVEIQDSGACSFSQVAMAGTNFTVTGTIANRGTSTQDLAARLRVRSAALAWGPTFDTDSTGSVDGVNKVKLNNTFPTATIGAITYPGAQGALKGAETATIGMTTNDLDSISYTSPNSDLSITNPATDEVTKTVQRIAGSYNVSTVNFQVQATRTANAAVTTNTVVVKIANVAAVITVAEPAARLRSGGNDGTTIQNHTITITSDQELLNAPAMSIGVGGGTLIGSWAGGSSVWTRTLQVHDDDVKGVYAWTSLSATNLAGTVTSAITGDGNYTLGGFVQRDLTFAAFSQTTALNVEAITYTKLQAGTFSSTGQPATRNVSQGDTSNLIDTYTVTALATNPTSIFWNDVAAAGANSGGTAQLLLLEEVI